MAALSVVVPAFDEEDQVEGTVRSLCEGLTALGSEFELVIVNDGSRDRTGEIVDRLQRELAHVHALHQEDQGIGGAFRTGMLAAQHEYVILWPADMPAEPRDLEPFVSRLGLADVIVGVRRRRIDYSALMRFNAWLYPKLIAALFKLTLSDVNWICAYRRSMLVEIPLRRRGIVMLAEILVGIRDRGGTFIEVEVDMKPREGGVASASRFRVMARTLKELSLMTWERHTRE